MNSLRGTSVISFDDWKDCLHESCSNNRLVSPGGRLPTCEDSRVPINVGGMTNGAASSQQETAIVTNTIRIGDWASGIMSLTTA